MRVGRSATRPTLRPPESGRRARVPDGDAPIRTRYLPSADPSREDPNA